MRTVSFGRFPSVALSTRDATILPGSHPTSPEHLVETVGDLAVTVVRRALASNRGCGGGVPEAGHDLLERRTVLCGDCASRMTKVVESHRFDADARAGLGPVLL